MSVATLTPINPSSITAIITPHKPAANTAGIWSRDTATHTCGSHNSAFCCTLSSTPHTGRCSAGGSRAPRSGRTRSAAVGPAEAAARRRRTALSGRSERTGAHRKRAVCRRFWRTQSAWFWRRIEGRSPTHHCRRAEPRPSICNHMQMRSFHRNTSHSPSFTDSSQQHTFHRSSLALR